MMVLFNLKKNM